MGDECTKVRGNAAMVHRRRCAIIEIAGNYWYDKFLLPLHIQGSKPCVQIYQRKNPKV